MDHNDLLKQFEGDVGLMGMENDIAFMKLRAELVEKYGEEGVRKVEEHGDSGGDHGSGTDNVEISMERG